MKKGGKKGGKKESEQDEAARMGRLKFAYLELKYDKETKFSKLNVPKLSNTLRALLRDIKIHDLYSEIEILSQAFERIVDRKDNVIRNLTDDIRLAEEQHHITLSGHLEKISKFIEIQESRLNVLKMDFIDNKDDLFEDFGNQVGRMQKTEEKDTDSMADLSYALETLYLGVENQYKSEFRNRVDEIRNRNVDERQSMRTQLEVQMEQTWQQMQLTLQEYHEGTEDRRRAYYALLQKDQKNGRTIHQQMDMIQTTADTIGNLKLRIAEQSNEHENRTRSLVEDRKKMKNHFMELKTHLKKVDQQHKDILIHLTSTTDKILKEMKEMMAEAEKILRLGAMCAKYESEEEKILPFYESSLTESDIKEIEELESESFQEPLAMLLNDYTGLDNFWKRFNKVYLDKLCLEKEQAALLTENERICHMLRQYLENITVHEDTISRPENTLLMVNTEIKLHFQSVPTSEKRVKRRATTAVTDAAYIFQQSKLSA